MLQQIVPVQLDHLDPGQQAAVGYGFQEQKE